MFGDPNAAPQLISYIAPAAPATRRLASGDELYLRPEIGFTPNWYRKALGIDFSEIWHRDPGYRLETRIEMAEELKRRFPGIPIGGINSSDCPDVLTGTFGVLLVPGIFGVKIQYAPDRWPDSEPVFQSINEIFKLEPPNLNHNLFFCDFMEQLDWIKRKVGVVRGYIVGQGVLNNAYRLLGPNIFLALLKEPGAVSHLFACITETIIEVVRVIQNFQRESGFKEVEEKIFTVSNCLVNMVSPKTYVEMLLPFDLKIAEAFSSLGVHNCAWDATPYLNFYCQIPNLGYIDMGIETDLKAAKRLFPYARRAVMYKTRDLVEKDLEEIKKDITLAAKALGPCDLVLADIDIDVPDKKIRAIYDFCMELNEEFGGKTEVKEGE